ncbi:MAG: glycosyltransferase [Flavobacteriales bacterium]|nr:glycosyltransferase [Flavobacteriales bacterium]
MKPNLLIISNYRDPIAPIRPEAEIILRLKKEGYTITVMTPMDGYYPKKLKEAGCTMIDHLPSGKFERKTIDLIKHAVAQESIDIIHAFNSKAIANAAWAVWGNKKVKLVSYRGYTGNIHWYDPTNYISFLNPRINFMVCLAESVREMYLKNGVGSDRAITINKGHDPAWYADVQAADLSEFNIPADAMVCALVANYRTKMKGIRYIVEAASQLPKESKVHFLMIGKGLKSAEIEPLLKSKSVENRFTFTGFRTDAPNLVKASDVSISASLFGEATQKAVIEAMNLGSPMIITDISGNRGLVEDGISGFVVAPADGPAIKNALIKLEGDASLRARMGEEARRHIAKFLSIDRSVKEYAQFYDRLGSE